MKVGPIIILLLFTFSISHSQKLNRPSPYGEQARISARVAPLETLVKLSARQLAEEYLQALLSFNDGSFYLRVDYDTPSGAKRR
jgi:hypothetical protein